MNLKILRTVFLLFLYCLTTSRGLSRDLQVLYRSGTSATGQQLEQWCIAHAARLGWELSADRNGFSDSDYLRAFDLVLFLGADVPESLSASERSAFESYLLGDESRPGGAHLCIRPSHITSMESVSWFWYEALLAYSSMPTRSSDAPARMLDLSAHTSGAAQAQTPMTARRELPHPMPGAGLRGARYCIFPAELIETGDSGTGDDFPAHSLLMASASWLCGTNESSPAFADVYLLSTQADKDIEKVDLSWQASAALHPLLYEIERGGRSGGWELLETLPAEEETPNYTWCDAQALPGCNLYRIRVLDIEGNIHYSNSVAVMQRRSDPRVKVFPNPAVGPVSVEVEADIAAAFVLRIENQTGQVLMTTAPGPTEARGSYTLDMSLFPAGYYRLVVSAGNKETVKPICKR